MSTKQAQTAKKPSLNTLVVKKTRLSQSILRMRIGMSEAQMRLKKLTEQISTLRAQTANSKPKRKPVAPKYSQDEIRLMIFSLNDPNQHVADATPQTTCPADAPAYTPPPVVGPEESTLDPQDQLPNTYDGVNSFPQSMPTNPYNAG